MQRKEWRNKLATLVYLRPDEVQRLQFHTQTQANTMNSNQALENTILFQPTKIGRSSLQHRIVHAPTTRYRANDAHAHTDLALEYYSQRASTAGTMIIAEATFVSHQSIGRANAPGIYTPEQIAAWKKVR